MEGTRVSSEQRSAIAGKSQSLRARDFEEGLQFSVSLSNWQSEDLPRRHSLLEKMGSPH
jgi:hypothetical protein